MARNISDERLRAIAREAASIDLVPEDKWDAPMHDAYGTALDAAHAVLKELGYRQVPTGTVTLDVPVEEKGGFICLEDEK